MAEAPAEAAQASGSLGGFLGSVPEQVTGGGGQKPAGKGGGHQRMSTTEVVIRSAATSMARTVGTQVGRAILRNVPQQARPARPRAATRLPRSTAGMTGPKPPLAAYCHKLRVRRIITRSGS